jgi:hypothetical protein
MVSFELARPGFARAAGRVADGAKWAMTAVLQATLRKFRRFIAFIPLKFMLLSGFRNVLLRIGADAAI